MFSDGHAGSMLVHSAQCVCPGSMWAIGSGSSCGERASHVQVISRGDVPKQMP